MNPGEKIVGQRGRGLFIVIEGIDGTGKSTLSVALQQELMLRGVDCLCTFEPSDGVWGKRLRESFSSSERLLPHQELELFIKDRQDHVKNTLIPAIEAGKVVVCDRYYFSTMAYQGARGMDMEKIRRQNQEFAPVPDVVFLLELPVDQALDRITGGRGEKLNSFEKEEYLRKVAENFNSLKDEYIVRIDASRPQDELLLEAMRHIKPLLGLGKV